MHFGISDEGYKKIASLYSDPTDEQGGWDNEAYDNTYYRLWIDKPKGFYAIAIQPKGVYVEDVLTYLNKYDALDEWERIRENAAEKAWALDIQASSYKVSQEEEILEEPQEETLEDLQNRLVETYGVDLRLMPNPAGFVLSKIVVPEESRGSGIGSQVMEEITAFADMHGSTIGLTPEDTYGGSVSRLKQFYKDFGFVPNKGRNKDYSFMEAFVRYPQG